MTFCPWQVSWVLLLVADSSTLAMYVLPVPKSDICIAMYFVPWFPVLYKPREHTNNKINKKQCHDIVITSVSWAETCIPPAAGTQRNNHMETTSWHRFHPSCARVLTGILLFCERKSSMDSHQKSRWLIFYNVTYVVRPHLDGFWKASWREADEPAHILEVSLALHKVLRIFLKRYDNVTLFK
jgi:hypothetical protein